MLKNLFEARFGDIYTCNSHTGVTEAGRSRVPGQPGLGYIVRPCLKKRKLLDKFTTFLLTKEM
jgi:hypothetical protein